jgi:hypothetical protein
MHYHTSISVYFHNDILSIIFNHNYGTNLTETITQVKHYVPTLELNKGQGIFVLIYFDYNIQWFHGGLISYEKPVLIMSSVTSKWMLISKFQQMCTS